MTVCNEHIREYLDDYIEMISPPDFAVLIAGPWGSGKTWFINQYAASRSSKTRRFLCASLFGLSSVASIHTQLFLATKPKFRARGIQFTARILNEAARQGLKVDASGVATTAFDMFATRPSDVIVLDDLERCALSSIQLLGIINEFVEHRHLGVILLANEERLKALFAPEAQDEYMRQIEKVIGQRFTVTPDFDSALPCFLAKPALARVATVLTTCRDSIAAVFAGSGHGNLRALDKALWDYGRLYSLLPGDLRSNQELQRHLLTNHLIYRLAVVCEGVSPDALAQIPTASIAVHLRKDKGDDGMDPMVKAVAAILERHGELRPEIPLLNPSDWTAMLRDGVLNRDSIVAALRSGPYAPEDAIPDWMKLWHYMQLSDEDFARVRASVVGDLRNSNLENVYVTLHVAGILIRLAEHSLIELSADEVERLATQCIAKCVAAEERPLANHERFSGEDWSSYRGLGYAAMDTPNMQRLIEHIYSARTTALQEGMPSVGGELMAVMASDATAFYRMVTLGNNGESIYYNVPIFTYIAPDQFVERLESLPPENRITVSSAFRARYRHLNATPELLREGEWLHSVCELLRERGAKSLVLLSAFFLREFAEKTLVPAIEQIRAYVASRNGHSPDVQ